MSLFKMTFRSTFTDSHVWYAEFIYFVHIYFVCLTDRIDVRLDPFIHHQCSAPVPAPPAVALLCTCLPSCCAIGAAALVDLTKTCCAHSCGWRPACAASEI